MFTGLIEKMGRVVDVQAEESRGHIILEADAWDPPIQTGESTAVDGVCLTALPDEQGRLHYDILQETFKRTVLGDRRVGDRVNLERALREGQPLGGHIVQGHVDGVGEVRAIRREGGDYVVEIACRARLLDEMVFKGSVAVNGISLTVVDAETDWFSVHIIPHTWEVTNFQDLETGRRVNVETDILAKYARRLLERGAAPRPPEWEDLTG